MIPHRLAEIIIGAVSFIWVCNFFAQFIVKGYEPDPSINGVFGAIVGGALALTQRGSSTPTAEAKKDTPPGDDTQ